MDKHNYKVGDTVLVKNNGSYGLRKFKKNDSYRITELNNFGYYGILNDEKETLYMLDHELKDNNIKFKVGDHIVTESGDLEREIIAVKPVIRYTTADIYDGTRDESTYDQDDLATWKLKENKIEYTVAEIAEKLGVDVNSLRIKE